MGGARHSTRRSCSRAARSLRRAVQNCPKPQDGASIGGLGMVSEIKGLAGDRAYVLLDRDAFGSWRDGGGQFAITRADGSVESGNVGFNRGGTGGSLHEGFDIQGVTGNRDVPRLQWNYRHCDGLADIDVDGYAPWDFFHHLTYANSDARQWHRSHWRASRARIGADDGRSPRVRSRRRRCRRNPSQWRCVHLGPRGAASP